MIKHGTDWWKHPLTETAGDFNVEENDLIPVVFLLF